MSMMYHMRQFGWEYLLEIDLEGFVLHLSKMSYARGLGLHDIP
jgi:hypothetical protein